MNKALFIMLGTGLIMNVCVHIENKIQIVAFSKLKKPTLGGEETGQDKNKEKKSVMLMRR